MMKSIYRYTLFVLVSAISFGQLSCETSKPEVETTDSNPIIPSDEGKTENIEQLQTAADGPIELPVTQIPEGYIVFDTVMGDLNKDGIEDCVLMIKSTADEKIMNRFDVMVDRNRRGIMVFFREDNQWKLETKNLSCFSSENEDGGVYFPPELYFEIENAKLYIRYAHGRYGFWKYTFRYQDNAFKLIGYDNTSSQGPIAHYVYSYNFLTLRKWTQENINFYSENPENEVFEDKWEDIPAHELIRLEQIEDFDELHFD